ncbi:hypothetical protein K469DRAFT_490418, partial [Zopfia rhizophila CBS 207.26]
RCKSVNSRRRGAGINPAKHESVVKRRQYKCHECQRSFGKPENLKRHKAIHSDEKPYKCKICEKSFGRIDNCRQHYFTH